MQYTSTRNGAVNISANQAIVNGISSDGGLYVPSSFPKFSADDISALIEKTYPERAAEILSKYLDDFSYEELIDYTKNAYSRFDTDDVCPVYKADDGLFILELTHGPTLAFKDVALTLLPLLLTSAAEKTGEKKKILILVATSGDTGKAALEGFKDVDGTEIIVFYPSDGVSEMQKLQMQTQEGKNVHVAGILGNFDDAQRAVKSIFTDKTIGQKLNQKGFVLSSANSINWGRLVPQIVYYFSAYCELIASNEIINGEKVNFVVPSGNFGDILAGYYAKRMGLPVNKLICASNNNNVLADFFETGVYDTSREFYKTVSPSMDILVSSNLERFLFDISGNDDKFVLDKMTELKENGKYSVPIEMLEKSDIIGGFANEDDTKMAIDCFFDSYDYPLDTHTAVAMTVYNNYVAGSGDNTPTVIISTASPYKFPVDVYNALSHENVEKANEAAKRLQALSGRAIPPQIAGLAYKPVLHDMVVDIDKISEAVFGFVER